MARWDWEASLLELRFPSYTKSVRAKIGEVLKSHKCTDTHDLVLDAIWTSCAEDLARVVPGGRPGKRTSGSVSNELGADAREALRTYVDQARDYEAELADLDDHSLEAQYLSTFGEIVKAKRVRRDRASRENDRWAFFNKPEAAANFERYRGKFVTPAAAVALSLGKDPEVVTPESLTPYRTVAGSIFREDFKDRLDRVGAAVRSGDLTNPMSVERFVTWAISQNLALPPELAERELEDSANPWKSRCERAEAELAELRRQVDDLPPKSMASISRLILGMAIARYEYRTDQRSSTTTSILKDLEQIGLDLKHDAIRDSLSDAARRLDFSWVVPIRWSGISSELETKR